VAYYALYIKLYMSLVIVVKVRHKPVTKALILSLKGLANKQGSEPCIKGRAYRE